MKQVINSNSSEIIIRLDRLEDKMGKMEDKLDILISAISSGNVLVRERLEPIENNDNNGNNNQ
jgi:hypothetical protein